MRHRLQDAQADVRQAPAGSSRTRLRAAAARCTGSRRCAASVDGQPANFVVDTGGEVISISQATATALAAPRPAGGSAEGLRHVGLGQGRVPDAGRRSGVRLDPAIKNFPVVVLNLHAPSALLGFQLGGIVGHKFLSKYRVGDRSRAQCGARTQERVHDVEGAKAAEDPPPFVSSSRAFSRSARRLSASLARSRAPRRSPPAAAAPEPRVPSRSIATKVRIRAAGQLARAGQRLLREDVDLRPRATWCRRAVTRAFRMIRSPTLIEWRNCRSSTAAVTSRRAGVAVAGDRAGDVDEVHDRAAEDEPERVGVVRQHDLHHLGGRVGGALGRPALRSVVAFPVDEGLQGQSQLGRELFLANGSEQRNGATGRCGAASTQRGHCAGALRAPAERAGGSCRSR